MFDMTNDSGLFLDPRTIGDGGRLSVRAVCWRIGDREWVPLYEGKMVQAFDHRAADIVVIDENISSPSAAQYLSAPKSTRTRKYSCVIPQYLGRATK